MGQVLPVVTDAFLGPDVLEDLLSVAEELVEEQGVRHEHGEEAHDEVEELTEAEVEMVSCESGSEVREVAGDLDGVSAGPDDVLEHASLKEVPPQRSGHLGEAKAECEEEWQPEIVGSDRSISRRVHLGLVHEAAGGLALEMLLDVGSAVDPAVGPEREKWSVMQQDEVFGKEINHSINEENWFAGQ